MINLKYNKEPYLIVPFSIQKNHPIFRSYSLYKINIYLFINLFNLLKVDKYEKIKEYQKKSLKVLEELFETSLDKSFKGEL